MWCLQLVSAGGLLNLFLSLSIPFIQQSSPWASPALQSRAPSPSRHGRPLWVLQKLLCGLTSKHWHSSCDAAKLINLVPPHSEPRHKGFHSLKLELTVCLSQKCPPAPPGICVAVRFGRVAAEQLLGVAPRGWQSQQPPGKVAMGTNNLQPSS